MTQDRDKYQVELSPFEALALTKYTNLPSGDRLAELSASIISLHNDLSLDRPTLALEINGTWFTNSVGPIDQKGYKFPDQYTLVFLTNRFIQLVLANCGDAVAEHLTVEFTVVIDPTNILASQWIKEPPVYSGYNTFHSVAQDTYGAMMTWTPQSIEISKSYDKKVVVTTVRIHADRSKTLNFPIAFMLPD